MIDAQELANRYVAVWMESDPARRREQIAALWIPEGEHFVDTREARGYEALEARVAGSHEKNVRLGGYRFRAMTNALALRDVVTFGWEMLRGDEVVGSGFEVLLITPDGRIRTDYQFFLN